MSSLFWENPGIQIVSGVSTVAIFSMKNAFQEMAKSTAKLTSTGTNKQYFNTSYAILERSSIKHGL